MNYPTGLCLSFSLDISAVISSYSNMRPFVKRFHTEFNLTLHPAPEKKFRIIFSRLLNEYKEVLEHCWFM